MLKRLLVVLCWATLVVPALALAQDQAPGPGGPASPDQAAPPPPTWEFRVPGPREEPWERRGPRWQGPGFAPGMVPGMGPETGPPFGGRGRFGGRGFYSRGFGQGPGFGAGPGGFGPGQRRDPFIFAERLRQELGLTEEQVNRLRQMHNEARKNHIRQRADLEIKQLDLQQLLSASKPDRAAIDRAIREIADLRAAQMKAGIDQRLAFQDMLTAEQKEKLRAFRQRGFGRGGFGPGAAERPGPGGRTGPGTRGRPGRPTEPNPPPSPPQL